MKNRLQKKTYLEKKEALLKDLSTPARVRRIVQQYDALDVVDACNELETLVELFNVKCAESVQSDNGLISGLNEAGLYYLGII